MMHLLCCRSTGYVLQQRSRWESSQAAKQPYVGTEKVCEPAAYAPPSYEDMPVQTEQYVWHAWESLCTENRPEKPFKITHFHGLRHTFDTMIIAGSCGVRTAASCGGHTSVSVTLDIYAELGHYATSAAVIEVKESSGAEIGSCSGAIMGSVISVPKRRMPTLTFSVGPALGDACRCRGGRCFAGASLGPSNTPYGGFSALPCGGCERA